MNRTRTREISQRSCSTLGTSLHDLSMRIWHVRCLPKCSSHLLESSSLSPLPTITSKWMWCATQSKHAAWARSGEPPSPSPGTSRLRVATTFDTSSGGRGSIRTSSAILRAAARASRRRGSDGQRRRSFGAPPANVAGAARARSKIGLDRSPRTPGMRPECHRSRRGGERSMSAGRDLSDCYVAIARAPGGHAAHEISERSMKFPKSCPKFGETSNARDIIACGLER